MPDEIVPFTGDYAVVDYFAEPLGVRVTRFYVGDSFPLLESPGEFGYVLRTLTLPDPAAIDGAQP